MAKVKQKEPQVTRIEYVVTEVEGRSGAVSNIFNKLDRAEAYMAKVVAEPSYGTIAVELWESRRYQRVMIPKHMRRHYNETAPIPGLVK